MLLPTKKLYFCLSACKYDVLFSAFSPFIYVVHLEQFSHKFLTPMSFQIKLISSVQHKRYIFETYSCYSFPYNEHE